MSKNLKIMSGLIIETNQVKHTFILIEIRYECSYWQKNETPSWFITDFVSWLYSVSEKDTFIILVLFCISKIDRDTEQSKSIVHDTYILIKKVIKNSSRNDSWYHAYVWYLKIYTSGLCCLIKKIIFSRRNKSDRKGLIITESLIFKSSSILIFCRYPVFTFFKCDKVFKYKIRHICIFNLKYFLVHILIYRAILRDKNYFKILYLTRSFFFNFSTFCLSPLSLYVLLNI
jgi:hypothetical protein